MFRPEKIMNGLGGIFFKTSKSKIDKIAKLKKNVSSKDKFVKKKSPKQ